MPERVYDVRRKERISTEESNAYHLTIFSRGGEEATNDTEKVGIYDSAEGLY